MANINELLARAAALRDETQLNSIGPERAGGIMYETLLALNELWLQQGAALVISKIYASVTAMEADTSPVSDLTGKPIRPGMVVVIASSDSDNGSVYRYNGTSSPSWSLVGEIGNLEPVDSLDSDSTSLPLAAHQGKVLDGKISQLGQNIQKSFSALGFVNVIQHNGYLKANGDYEGTSSYHSITSKKISCKEGDVFKYKGDGHGEAVSALFYNNGVISSSYQVNSKSNYANITIPANVDSVVFSSFAGISENVVFELIFVTEVISHIEQDIDNVAAISNNNDKVLNGEIKSAYSNLSYDTTLLSCSILKSTKFQIKVEVEGGQSPAFSRFIINYNDSTASNKRLMDTTNMSFLGTWMDFVAPDDLVYLGFYTDASHANIRMYLKTYGIIQEIGIDSFPLRNKIGVSFGDSIMAGDGNSGVGVLDLLIRDFGCTGQDYAVGGASCAYHEGRGHIVAQIQSYIQNHLSDDLDFILLDGLSNDITTSELGELSASFDYVSGGYADYTKGLEYCIGLLTNSFPTIPIIYFIPHSTPARDYSNELTFGNRAREVCKKWSIPVADIYLDGCLNTRISSQHSQYGDASGTHPNEAGYLHSYIPLISSELIKIIPSD